MIHILGAGSLGLLWAARLAADGIPATLLLRDSASVRAWQDNGGCVELREGQRTRQIPVAAQANDAAGTIECLILATKAYSALDALQAVKARLTDRSQVLMLQNGIGAQLQVRTRWPDLRLLYASVTDGAWMAGFAQVVWAGRGNCRIGDPDGGPPPEWLEQLTRSGIHWQWAPDIQAVLWQKLAVNCAINPLSVIHDCCNGQVPVLAPSRFALLIDELERLLVVQNAAMQPGELDRRVRDITAQTASNSSSMRQDVQAGRRTEIDYILGHAIREASARGLETPALDALLAETRYLLSARGLPSD
jgi:2-dehydropantoate 2-reductase